MTAVHSYQSHYVLVLYAGLLVNLQPRGRPVIGNQQAEQEILLPLTQARHQTFLPSGIDSLKS